MLRIAATSLALVVTATLVAGCGGSGQSPAEAHLATLANDVCRTAEDIGLQPGLPAKLARLRAQLNADQELPRVATYVADAQARVRSQATLSRLSYKQYGPSGSALLRESFRLKGKIQSDVKALGWTACTGLGAR